MVFPSSVILVSVAERLFLVFRFSLQYLCDSGVGQESARTVTSCFWRAVSGSSRHAGPLSRQVCLYRSRFFGHKFAGPPRYF
jgi:hypothetical protein